MNIDSFSEPTAFLRGLKQLRQTGVTPRGLLFLALSPDGHIHVGYPKDSESVTQIKVGEKLALVWPLEGRYFHFDAIHRLPGDFLIWNGDRRLKDPGDAADVAALIASFLKGSSAKNVLFGCTPHQPGCWLGKGRDVTPLHEGGLVEVVPVASGLLARRIMDAGLYYLPMAHIGEARKADKWQRVFESPLGNVLVLERRVIGDRIVMSCEQGLVEVNVGELPNATLVGKAPSNGSMAVVGRIDGGAFAVTTGQPQPWGLDEMRPALLVGGAGDGLAALGRALAATKRS